MTPDDTRALRHELRTPVNHLIGYSELLLEDHVEPAGAVRLQAICATAKAVLDLVPGLLGDGADAEDSLRTLAMQVAVLEADTTALVDAPGTMPPTDIARLVAAAGRLRELTLRLTTGPAANEQPTGATPQPIDGLWATILVVDDDEGNREVLSRRLQRLGYGIVEAADGIEALQRLSDGGIDLVLLDLMMPRLDGFGVLDRLREDPYIRHIPVIMISALDDMASIVRCIEAGAADYLPKPFDPVLLKARVGACLEKKHLRDAERGMLATIEVQASQLREWNEQLERRVAEQVQEVERLSLMRRFLPPQLADVIASGGADLLKSHRREIAALFCDLRGFTSFSERSEPEDVMAVLAEMHDAVGPLIFELEGTLAQFTGDGMMVFFNDPIPCPDPARRAVALGIGMRERAELLSAEWARRGHQLRLGVGVAVGYATCGQIGFDGRYEYTAIGTVVNLAARLCGEAAGGEVLASQRVVEQLGSSVVATPVGDITLKGMAAPVAAFRVERLAP